MPDTRDTSATQTTRMQHQCDTSNMSATRATRVLHERHECDTRATSTTREQHEWKTLILITARLKTFSHPYIYYMTSERLQGKEQFHTKSYLLEMSHFQAKMRLKSAPQKLYFLMTKAISKSCTLDCNCKCHCMFPHSYPQ